MDEEQVKKRRRRIEDKLRKNNLKEEELKLIEHVIDHLSFLKNNAN